MKWFTTLRDRKLNTATELLTTTSTQLARRRGCKNLLPNPRPIGPEITIARDFMLAGQGGVIDCLHFRGQASRTYLTIIIITHSVKVARIVCENRLMRFGWSSVGPLEAGKSGV